MKPDTKGLQPFFLSELTGGVITLLYNYFTLVLWIALEMNATFTILHTYSTVQTFILSVMKPCGEKILSDSLLVPLHSTVITKFGVH